MVNNHRDGYKNIPYWRAKDGWLRGLQEVRTYFLDNNFSLRKGIACS